MLSHVPSGRLAKAHVVSLGILLIIMKLLIIIIIEDGNEIYKEKMGLAAAMALYYRFHFFDLFQVQIYSLSTRSCM